MKVSKSGSINSHNPLPDNVYLSGSRIHGYGIFAAKEFPANHELGVSHIVDERFPDNLIRTPLGGFINHSFHPNCKIYEHEDTLRIKTTQVVQKDEELTADYRPWYSDEALSQYQ